MTSIFRRMLDDYRNRIIIAPGVHDPLCARIAEKIGFDCIYMTGAGTSLSRLGWADMGLTTATEVVMNAKYIASVVNIPLLADADTGYGNALNVMRTVREYISSGAAGVHIEDQVWPKRCGHLKGKLTIPMDEMIGKIRAAKKVIDEEDPDFVLIGRTDVRGVTGGTIDEAIKRMNAYVDAGADIVFADGLVSREEVERMAKEVYAPTLFHPTGISPRLSIDECRELGIAVVLYPFASIHASAVAVYNFMKNLKMNGTSAQTEFEEKVKGHPIGDIRRLFDIAGLRELQKLERLYLPAEEVDLRYRESVGL